MIMTCAACAVMVLISIGFGNKKYSLAEKIDALL